MPARGKHRRPRNSRLSRGIAVASTGGAALALPLTGAAAASAAPAAAPAAIADKPAAAPAAAKAAKTAKAVTYTVTAGDTLSGIAEEHSVRGGWKKLYQDNRKAVGDDPSLIRPGLRLTVGAKAPAAKGKPAAKRSAPARADRSEARPAVAPLAAKAYTDDLDGWIRESLDVMARNGIPGTYEGIHRNIMRESSGNPSAINNWDSNAAAGTPSKGLLQVIDPTFRAYHVPGTSMDPFDPVANITAACNYAADRYGSIDNVHGAY
ncbi:LysM peptidoglycan-binding domain-containing protein [Streptomyces sudanensis]|uniref:LysM peptidoglycan-binding domain-containing protein n=1 Tax=Streptomyces sudanensis TaxID=436397 RepID=UPI0020CC0EF1|nr:LysM peptidoglycan-binding domain-containing protein [Streptomyces sudanensis]MCP9989027.1 LysM peptidoglycan-binding domain-containing protein [Streptomyces sudanensis]